MFKRKQENMKDIYTPQREDKNKKRKVIIISVLVAIVLGILAVGIFRPNGVNGGATLVKVDKTGQTPDASMYTPREEADIYANIVEADGSVATLEEDSYGQHVTENITTALNYVAQNLSKDDNPNIDNIDMQTTLDRMAKEKDQWQNVFYSEITAFEVMQLMNITNENTLTEQEKTDAIANQEAVADPSAKYEIVPDSITLDDQTAKDSDHYVINVQADYKAGDSLPVRIQLALSLSAKGRIFDVQPLAINTITNEEAPAE